MFTLFFLSLRTVSRRYRLCRGEGEKLNDEIDSKFDKNDVILSSYRRVSGILA